MPKGQLIQSPIGEQIEKMVDKRKAAIDKMTLRLMPYIRKGEDARLRKVQKKTR